MNVTGDIILHMCTKNHNYMMYGSLDTERNRQIFLSFRAIFCPFNPLTICNNSENKEKMLGDIIILQVCTTNDNQLMYGS